MPLLELRIPPPLVALACAVLMWGASRAVPALGLQVPAPAGVALALAATGVVVALAGVFAFRRRRTTVNPTRPGAAACIVSGGIYRLSRNPMYLGMLLALAGWCWFLANAAAALLLPAFAAYITRFQIVPEERALLAKFGPAYTRYKAQVRRWL